MVGSAHHGGAAFDSSKTTTYKGTVTELQFANPHVLVFFDVKDENGQTKNWSGWLTAPNKLARAGWTKRTLKPGDAVTVTGAPHKEGAPVIQIRSIAGPDGKPLPTFED
ncbi:MAG: DUF6152 family protein [Vicinamibacterales bacterium]